MIRLARMAPALSRFVVLPLAALERLAGSCLDGELTGREVSSAMGSLARGRLLDVRDGRDRVRVWLF